MKNLTKENFFNDLQERSPLGLKVFTDWIDQYKISIRWDKLFSNSYVQGYYQEEGSSPVVTVRAPKYHDLPFALQMGIYLQFCQERGGCFYEVDIFDFDLGHEIIGMVNMLQMEAEIELEAE